MRFLSLLVSVFFFASLTTSAVAAEIAGWPALTLMAGGYSFDGAQELDAGTIYGLKLGFDFNGKHLGERLGFEGVFYQGTAQDKTTADDVDVSMARIDLLYLFNQKKSWVPFLTAGVGGQFVQRPEVTDRSAVVALGGGVKYFFTDYLALRGDVRRIMVFDDEMLGEYEYALGLTYLFGKERKAKPKPALDTDGDGVSDEKDLCSGTPAGLKVDRKGCPINPADADDDGIPDYLDQCAETPVGYSVDQNGCPFDADRDGVPDELDKCPANPPGFKVDKDGCMDMGQN